MRNEVAPSHLVRKSLAAAGLAAVSLAGLSHDSAPDQTGPALPIAQLANGNVAQHNSDITLPTVLPAPTPSPTTQAEQPTVHPTTVSNSPATKPSPRPSIIDFVPPVPPGDSDPPDPIDLTPDPTFDTPPEEDSMPPLQDIHPERLTIPGNVASIMNSETVYLPAMGCSGFLIRNADGTPVGIETAQHCGLLPHFDYGDNRWQNNNGNVTINFKSPFLAQTGSSMDRLSTIGEVTQMLVNTDPNSAPDKDRTGNDTDFVLGAFKGHSMDEVTSSFNHLSSDEVEALQPGDVVYNSGWPVDQPDNTSTSKERQNYAMSVLGTTTWYVDGDGLQLKLLVTAVKKDADGAECSWGDSGSAGFVVDSNGQPKVIGSLAAFTDFGSLTNKDDGDVIRRGYEAEFGIDLSGYDAICGYAYELPPNSDSTIATIISPEQTPKPPETTGDLMSQMASTFEDPNTPRHLIDGIVGIRTQHKEGPDTFEYYDKPVYSYSPELQTLLLGVYSPDVTPGAKAPEGLEILSFTGPEAIASVIAFSRDGGQTDPDLAGISTGTVGVDTPANGGGFVDFNGQRFGVLMTEPDDFATTTPYEAFSINQDTSALSLTNPVKGGDPTPSATPTPSPSATPTPLPSPTPSSTPTDTPTPSATPTP